MYFTEYKPTNITNTTLLDFIGSDKHIKDIECYKWLAISL